MEPTTQITDDEAQLYDRQIRLWGVDAQKRLRQANIAFAGVDGVGSEIIKNLVLAGINSITLLDDKLVDRFDTTSNLFTHRLIGQNRAQVASKYVESLNPMVQVRFEMVNIAEKDEQFFLQFQVVCVSGFDKETTIKINSICNKHNIKFYATNTWGMFGYGFVDLGHNYSYKIEEMNQSNDVTIEQATVECDDYDEPVRKKVKVEEPTIQVVEKIVDFVPFETALAVKAGKSGIGLTKRTNGILIIAHTLLEFHSKFSRFPSTATREQDIDELFKLQNEVLDRLGLDDNVLKNCSNWFKHVFGQLSPVCAVVGGVIGQDIIRSLSRNDAPIRNFFLFNGLNYTGVIESIGK